MAWGLRWLLHPRMDLRGGWTFIYFLVYILLFGLYVTTCHAVGWLLCSHVLVVVCAGVLWLVLICARRNVVLTVMSERHVPRGSVLFNIFTGISTSSLCHVN